MLWTVQIYHATYTDPELHWSTVGQVMADSAEQARIVAQQTFGELLAGRGPEWWRVVQQGSKSMPIPTHEVFVPGLGRGVKFQDRHEQKRGHPVRRMRLCGNGPTLPQPVLPIDWAKALTFPMDANDQVGDCMAAAACHGDNTWTGNVGTESVFDVSALVAWYEQLSGGDNGLDEGTLLGGWKAGLPGIPAATVLDAVDIDPTNAALAQLVAEKFLGFLFMLAVPDAWIQGFNPAGGAVWTSPATANPANGHGIWCNGCDAQGRYKMQTWGSFVWVTPSGVSVCDPSAFAVFSLRMFNSVGVAPDGETYDQKAALWTQLGGHALPPNPFSNNPPPPPPPPPPPIPGPTPINVMTWPALKAGQRFRGTATSAVPAGQYGLVPVSGDVRRCEDVLAE